MNAFVSIGPPPERHADRVVGNMLREMATKRAEAWKRYYAILKHSSDGSPAAQRKIASRIWKAGACRVTVETGKRGKYTLQFVDITGWNQFTDTEIKQGDPVPTRPWLACFLNSIESLGNGRNRYNPISKPVVLIAHHALSRAAQRHGASSATHLTIVAENIAEGALNFLVDKGWDDWLNAPPDGWRVPIGVNGSVTLVLKRHERVPALVAATLF